MEIGSVDGQTGGSLSFRHLSVAQAGQYRVVLTYVRNLPVDTTITLKVNNALSIAVPVAIHERNRITIPVVLHGGDNTVTVSYAGNSKFDIDNIRLRSDSRRD